MDDVDVDVNVNVVRLVVVLACACERGYDCDGTAICCYCCER